MRTGLIEMMNCLIFGRSHHQTIKTNSSSTEPITSAQKPGIYSFGNARTSSSIFVRHWRLAICPVILSQFEAGVRSGDGGWRVGVWIFALLTAHTPAAGPFEGPPNTCCCCGWRDGVASDQEPVWSALKATWLHSALNPNTSKTKTNRSEAGCHCDYTGLSEPLSFYLGISRYPSSLVKEDFNIVTAGTANCT